MPKFSYIVVVVMVKLPDPVHAGPLSVQVPVVVFPLSCPCKVSVLPLGVPD